jgi:hypothetical protein
MAKSKKLALGDYLNEMHKTGELNRLYRNGFISEKWFLLRDIWNYQDVIKSKKEICQFFGISRPTLWRYLKILNQEV